MIRRIRMLAASLHEDLSDAQRGLSASESALDEDDDPGLDLLVKNAVRSNWLEHDPRRVWKQLSERVRGPFGRMAVEEPALAGEPMPMAFEGHDAPERNSEPVRYRHFLLTEGVISQR
jgi:hypothetical protein